MQNQANSTHNLARDVAGTASGNNTAAVNVHSIEELSFFTKSDNEILESIIKTHVHAEDSIDVESLFLVVQNVMTRSTQIFDYVVQGKQVHVETIDKEPPKPSFSSPLCTLKSIGYELSCKSPCEEIAHKSTFSILKKLSNYSWEAKAVLTLAAFALDYGEFWHLAQGAQLPQTDQIAKSLAILKRVPVFLKPADLQKRRPAIDEVNVLIKSTVEVIRTILEIEKFHNYNIKNLPGMEMIPVDVVWAIITIVACASKIDVLISDDYRDTPDEDLSTYSQKIHFVLNNLKTLQKICNKHQEEEVAYQKIKKIIQISTNIVELIRALIFTKDKEQSSIIIGHTKETVTIDVLRNKHVLLFLSSLNVSDDDINVLNKIYDSIKEENKYCIVWIPIVETWTFELRNKFDLVKIKMPWYVVQYFSSIFGIRFIKEEWKFKASSTIVKVINSQGNVIYTNAFHDLWLRGIAAIDPNEDYYLPPFIRILSQQIDPKIQTWIREEKYIFVYGGKYDSWIQRFETKAQDLSRTVKEAKTIDINLCCVGNSGKGGEVLAIKEQSFWNIVESMFFSIISHHQVNPEAQEVQRLLSYKNEAGWALLCKGSTVVTYGHGSIVLKVVEEYENWKDKVVDDKMFATAFNGYYKELLKNTKYCCRVDFPRETEDILSTMTCSECKNAMVAITSYQCCHINQP